MNLRGMMRRAEDKVPSGEELEDALHRDEGQM